MNFCGIDCKECELNTTCKGCKATGGHPYGGSCIAAECCRSFGRESCNGCTECKAREQLICEINALGIEDMDEVTELNLLLGSYINSEYSLPGGQNVKLWDDNSVYFGNMLPKRGTERCYGIAADEKYLLVTEFGMNGADAEIVLLKRRK
ncbi:MAG: DUF3795 domain-containing protein [Oscillospiraceae bacterium]|nr:DUF3795 domain-containing protein [Oscillospiraceae bacterium]